MTYIVGETRTARSIWTDSDGEPVDPLVTLTVRDPADIVSTPTVTNPSEGTFEADLDLDLPGIWYGEWSGTTSEGTKICTFEVCVVPSSVLVSS